MGRPKTMADDDVFARWRASLGKARPSAALVLPVLASFAGRANRAYPTVHTIAAYAGISERNVKKELARLRSEGTITEVGRRRHQRGHPAQPVYQINYDGARKPPARGDDSDTPCGTRGDDSDTGRGDDSDTEGVTIATPNRDMKETYEREISSPSTSLPPTADDDADGGKKEVAHVITPERLAEIYNDVAVPALARSPRPRHQTRENLAARIRENPEFVEADYRAVFAAVANSPWHAGGNSSRWRASLPWIAQPNNWAKCVGMVDETNPEAAPRRVSQATMNELFGPPRESTAARHAREFFERHAINPTRRTQ